jgi:hypothetical protein
LELKEVSMALTGAQVKAARIKMELNYREAGDILGISASRVKAIECLAVLGHKTERRVIKLMWSAARMRGAQQVCPHCCGSGLEPRGPEEPLPGVYMALKDGVERMLADTTGPMVNAALDAIQTAKDQALFLIAEAVSSGASLDDVTHTVRKRASRAREYAKARERHLRERQALARVDQQAVVDATLDDTSPSK